MQVTSTTPTSASTSTSSTAAAVTAATASATTVDYNSFLKLLVEEMKNQDPTAPTDPTAFMSQLASFSSVEQQVQTNTKLDSLLTTNSLSQAESIIGKTVTSADGSTSGTVVSVLLGTGGTATATLANGASLALDSGVTVSGSTSSGSTVAGS